MTATKSTAVAEYRQMKADDPFKPVVIKPAPSPKKKAAGKITKKGK